MVIQKIDFDQFDTASIFALTATLFCWLYIILVYSNDFCILPGIEVKTIGSTSHISIPEKHIPVHIFFL